MSEPVISPSLYDQASALMFAINSALRLLP